MRNLYRIETSKAPMKFLASQPNQAKEKSRRIEASKVPNNCLIQANQAQDAPSDCIHQVLEEVSCKPTKSSKRKAPRIKASKAQKYFLTYALAFKATAHDKTPSNSTKLEARYSKSKSSSISIKILHFLQPN
ncbi:hypothetical protein Acr_18g0009540 [Actinidia rufa]|uniref:Uncharacterized protein n=1 Tax=Actinidia rufa TaxID=165716 RepID=A0A7J0G2X9_9ERIC|nr:hypothetical protein Acr_17g0007090 [Actinidia rufa]GFZ06784.1 hypothetical protein Acr_18g0009540 [Actinidia rufa]